MAVEFVAQGTLCPDVIESVSFTGGPLVTIALRAVTSTAGMTVDYYSFDHAFLGRVANRIINEVWASTG